VCDELLDSELHRTAALGRELDLHVEELAVERLRSTERAGTTVPRRHWTAGTTVRHWTGVVSATLPRGVHEHWQKKVPVAMKTRGHVAMDRASATGGS
jgi:hypothetical protein